ncbi:periplasmic heavy metal sensor [Ketobacter sp. MCCC 1A13808]|uniref:periplasmic heavy metal sensor n=1 Tax=Ketobacter sp. MCCC 1A13808 TaxID=2602738 RepID=UPI0012ECAB4B|nr:periplasmic heavy metal sensor [Ketobacter sp. MCCC 1A13808]MVF13004.1 periplasmic heavy metal sensor [Ketobacter sp. MCCC 1A13808]
MKYIIAILMSSMIAFSAAAEPMQGGRMMKGLTRHLDLSTEQQQQVEQIFESKRPQMEGLHEQMQALRESTNTEIKSVLNEDQQTKFEKMQEKREEKRDRFKGQHKKSGKHDSENESAE